MKPNKVAPWEGRLEWVGEPRTGKTKKGNDWTSVDFVLKYTDEQDYERHVMFNVFGDEKVNTIIACEIGTKIRVDWRPDAREYNGRWFGKNEVYGITVIEDEEKKGTELPPQAPSYVPQNTEDSVSDGDLPW